MHAEETAVEELAPAELVELCVRAFEQNNTAKGSYAEALAAQEGMTLIPEVRFQGMKCLKQHFGERFFFDPDRGVFISESEEQRVLNENAARRAALDELREEAEVQRALRRAKYEKRLRAACYDKLQEDEFIALTQPLCAEIFTIHGFRD
ncbi:hypothetical protein [Leisingera sp. ANG-M6]|uniref:hypothetical protein n=1 Tax=Leisingera sp. ANG-M6 TaxID=1577900 RepID=UPI0019D39E95|nr:hypothetical protein [Leisingera sp. ANG-M6]